MKRWTGFLLAICLLFALIPVPVQASTGASGSCGEVNWQISADGTLSITGSGRMLYHGGWNNQAIRKVVIGEGVTTICRGAFQNAANLTSAVIAGTVRSIGSYSFDGCTGLKQVWLPDSVVVVGEYAFRNCTALRDVRMGDRILMIGKYAFANCPLEVLDLPDKLLLLGSYSFKGCSMDTVVIPDTVTYLNEGTFQDCVNLKNLYIPDGVTGGYMPFDGCTALETVVIPESLNYYGMFSGCTGMNTMVFRGDYCHTPYQYFERFWSTFWYPADNRTWEKMDMEFFQENTQWIPYREAEDGTLVSVVMSEDTVRQRLEEQMEQYPEGMALDSYDHFFDGVRDALFHEQLREEKYSMEFDQLRVGDLIKKGTRDFTYAEYVVVEVHPDHVVAGGKYRDEETWEEYLTWREVLSREELENGFVDSMGSRGYYTYTTRYGTHQTLTLPKITEPQVDESRFPAEIRTTSASQQVRPSKFSSTGSLVNPFIDVPNDRFRSAILWAYYKGITTGTTTITFSPENTCTRKQIVTFLWRYNGCPEPKSYINPFSDVPADRFEKAILWAYYEGITTGTTDTTFSPNDPCTRKQIVTFLWRFAGRPYPQDAQNPFTDVPNDRFTQAILWAYHKGITTGTTTTTFSPEAPCTRKQIVTFLWRFSGMPNAGSAGESSGAEMILADYHIGDTVYLTEGRSVRIRFHDGPVELESSVEGVLILGENGVITGAAPGQTTVTVNYPGDEELAERYRTVTVIVEPKLTDDLTTQIRVSADGFFQDGMSAYLDDTLSVTFDVRRGDKTQRLDIHVSDTSIMDVTCEELYDSRTVLNITYLRPGDVTLTVTSEDGTTTLMYRIHVEEYYSFDPGHDALLSPEEVACYASLVAAAGGAVNMDSNGAWKEGAPSAANELTYDLAVAFGRSTANAWETSGYWQDGGSTNYIVNYVGDQEWNGQYCYRFQFSY